MKSISKLNLNTNPATFENGDIKYATGVVATKDQKAICNENGFDLIHTYAEDIIGRVNIPNGYVLFLKGTIYDKIVCVRDTTKTILSQYFNFSKTRPIKGRYTYNSDNELYITFTEGVEDNANETRIINIDNICPNTFIVLTQDAVNNLDFIPNLLYPSLSFEVLSEGSLLIGTYQIAIAYLIEDSIYTNYSILHEPVYVFDDIENHSKIGNSISRSIKVISANLDTRYTKYKIGVLYKGLDEFETCYETDDILITSGQYTISNLNSLLSISIDDLTVGSITYVKDQDHVNFNGRMLRANVKTIRYTDSNGVSIDTVMNTLCQSISVKLANYTPSNSFVHTNIINKHFKAGEQYLLYIGAIDKKGNFVNAYHIPWNATCETEEAFNNSDHTISIHKIPYREDNLSTYKEVSKLYMVLPSDVQTILGEFANVITSFCFFYAEHNLNNSKVLGQGFAIRDHHVNTFATQTYLGFFASTTKVRFYSFEHLFNKSTLSNVSLYNSRKLYGFDEADVVTVGLNQVSRYIKRFESPILEDKVLAAITNVRHVTNDNTVQDNIAGDSYHRLTMTASEANKIFGGTASLEDGHTYIILYTSTHTDDVDYVNWNRMAIADMISNNDYFYDDIYNQQLVICSNIIPSIAPASPLDWVILSGDFFFDNMTIRSTGPISSYRYGDVDVSLQSDDYVYKIITSIDIESRFNLRARFNGTNDYQKVFNIDDVGTPLVNPTPDTLEFIAIPYVHDNFINTPEGKGYSLSCHNNGYDNIDYIKELDLKYHFFNRVVRSIVTSQEAKGIAWRIFNANDYKDFPIERGPINIIEADDRAAYIQQLYSLMVVSTQDTLSNDPKNTTYLGTSDLFIREPIEVLFDSKGYIGCDNRFSAIMTPYGYVILDPVRKNMFLVKGIQAKRLTDYKVEDWFKTNVESGLINPYNKSGFCLLYDDLLKSLFVSQQGIKAFTIHYNFPNEGFLSFHPYVPEMYLDDRTNTYCIKDNKVYKRNANNKGIYFDSTIMPSEITYIYNNQFEVYKQILAIVWDTFILKNNQVIYDITFDNLMIYNDTQCTGLILTNVNSDWFDTETGVFNKDSWFFNNIIDLVKNDKLPFIDSDGNLITSNIRDAHDWFDENNFISKYVFIKFGYDNKFTDINTKLKYDSAHVNASQLEIILNSYDVNAIKSIR